MQVTLWAIPIFYGVENYVSRTVLFNVYVESRHCLVCMIFHCVQMKPTES
jgi:hypothetical protein